MLEGCRFSELKQLDIGPNDCKQLSTACSYDLNTSPLGLNGGASSIWDFVSGSFSPSPSPVFSSLTSSASSADLARLFRDLDEAKRKIKQWEEAWHQVKQVSDVN